MGATSESPSASIIINNYNYGRFLAAAIDSALAQTYVGTEVIVVDDGSTDESRQVIASYGDRVVPVLKENGGQGSAFNAGFADSRGRLICFLDADDVFLPRKIAVTMRVWEQHPDASVIYHQLRAIDAEGRQLWDGKPWPEVLWRGQVRDKVERAGGWWPWPSTSGLCFPRSFLERVLPEPADDFRYCADAYLAGLAPFLGPVIGIEQPLSLYRVHGANWVTQFSDRRGGARRKAHNYAREFHLIHSALGDRFGLDSAMSLTDHYYYQYFRRRAGEPVAALQVLLAVLRCPILPPSAKLRELAKIMAGHV